MKQKYLITYQKLKAVIELTSTNNELIEQLQTENLLQDKVISQMRDTLDKQYKVIEEYQKNAELSKQENKLLTEEIENLKSQLNRKGGLLQRTRGLFNIDRAARREQTWSGW